jgi:hypothetical protein
VKEYFSFMHDRDTLNSSASAVMTLELSGIKVWAACDCSTSGRAVTLARSLQKSMIAD